MSDTEFLLVQKHELERLLSEAGSDPVLVPQLQERLADAQHDLEAAQQGQAVKRVSPLPRAAIFMRGGGVSGSEGIRPSLAGEALIQYEKMFIEQALHDEREAARASGRQRRPRGASSPELLFTGTPRGSFGLEFTPSPTPEHSLDELHALSLEHLADAILLAARSNAEEIMKQVPARVLQPLKQFMKSLADNGAELRLAFSNRASQIVSSDHVKIAAERLEREVNQETVELKGVFRGLTYESGHFDFNSDKLGTITGTVADSLSAEDLQRINSFTDRECQATLQRTIIKAITGASTPSFILLDVEPIASDVRI